MFGSHNCYHQLVNPYSATNQRHDNTNHNACEGRSTVQHFSRPQSRHNIINRQNIHASSRHNIMRNISSRNGMGNQRNIQTHWPRPGDQLYQYTQYGSIRTPLEHNKSYQY